MTASLALPACEPADVRSPAVPRRLVTVTAHEDLASVHLAWTDLLAVAPASAYQTPEWVAPWLAGLGQGITPIFVLGSDAVGAVALLALGRRRQAGLVTARFLGGRDSNIGLGLFHPDVAWDVPTLRRLLDGAARLGGIDLLWLANQPHVFGGRANPLAQLPGRPGPSLQHEMMFDGLPGTAPAPLGSSRSRKTIRQKEAKLAAVGPVRHAVASDGPTAVRFAETLLAQRAARFGTTGREAGLRDFLQAAAVPPPGTRPCVELHALSCGDTIVAAFAGAAHAGRFSGMLVSFAAEPEWARFSPGELLIARVMGAKAREGTRVFDLGIGEARYKDSLCPVAVPLFDTLWGATLRGRMAAAGLTGLLAAKRRIKQAPRLWAVLEHWRVRARRLSGRLIARRD